MKENALAQKFTKRTLIKYAVPTIIMMVFMSTYTIVDGLFISNVIGETALSATNIVVPVLMVTMALALMLASGANAIIAKFLGMKKDEDARQFLSVVYIAGTILGIVITGLIFLFKTPILTFLGAKGEMWNFANDYLSTLSIFLTGAVFQIFTQTFFVSTGKPMLGFFTCLMGGITNIILDYLFIAVFRWGMMGAALATGIGFCVPGIFGLIYFTLNKNGDLHFVKPKFNLRRFAHALLNGLGELISNMSMSVTTFMFNIILLRIAGEAGVAAISIILYLQMILSAMFMGFSFGISPVMSYKYGANDDQQIKLVRKTGFFFMAAVSVFIVSITLIFAPTMVSLFISRDSATFAYAFMGFNVFLTSMFTALSNGGVAALLATSRTLVFLVILLLTLPLIFGVNGVWMSLPIAEALTCIIAFFCYKKFQPKYNY